MNERKDFISVTSMYGANTHQPAVMFKWGAEVGVVTVNEARKHALRVLEAAEGAEGDAFIADWVRDNVIKGEGEADPDKVNRIVAGFLLDFRNARTLRAEKEGGV